MPQLITEPAVVPAAGTRPERIEEFVGRVSTGAASLSIARMTSPIGWVEPGQRPAFDEYTVVLHGRLRIESEDHSVLDVRSGGYPHLEEAYRTAELLFPAIGKGSPIFQTVQQAVENATACAGSPTVGRFSSI